MFTTTPNGGPQPPSSSLARIHRTLMPSVTGTGIAPPFTALIAWSNAPSAANMAVAMPSPGSVLNQYSAAATWIAGKLTLPGNTSTTMLNGALQWLFTSSMRKLNTCMPAAGNCVMSAPIASSASS